MSLCGTCPPISRYTWTCIVHVEAWGWSWVSFSITVRLTFGDGLSLSLEFTSWLGWSVHGPVLSISPNTGAAGTLTGQLLQATYTGYLSSGPCMCVPSPLLTEPSPWPLHLLLLHIDTGLLSEQELTDWLDGCQQAPGSFCLYILTNWGTSRAPNFHFCSSNGLVGWTQCFTLRQAPDCWAITNFKISA